MYQRLLEMTVAALFFGTTSHEETGLLENGVIQICMCTSESLTAISLLTRLKYKRPSDCVDAHA